MKFCIECGSRVDVETAKFCPNCGKGLLMNLSDQSPQSVKVLDSQGKNDTSSSLGVKLEEMVEQILRSTGYLTKRRERLVGRSGSTHEFNILATRASEIIAVDCKNCGDERSVGLKEIRDLDSKLKDVRQINDAMYVTNTSFSPEAQSYAKDNHITMWDGIKLSTTFFSLSIGRIDDRSNAEALKKPIIIDLMLPVNVTYENATKLGLVNPSAASISKATLFLHPYYVFDYKLDIARIDRAGKNHKIVDEGINLVDSLGGKIIHKVAIDSKDHVSSLFSKMSHQRPDIQEVVNDIEENQIIEDVANMESEFRYKLQPTPGYNVKILEPKMPLKPAERMVLEEIVEDNTQDISYDLQFSKGRVEKREMTVVPKYNEIRIRKASLVYVPKWEINIKAKEIIYTRKILAASNTKLMDELEYCPKDFSRWKVWHGKRPTYAICDVCGTAYCEDHISRVNDVYLCEDHVKG